MGTEWTTVQNWFDNTTGAVAARAPNSTDDITFDNQSGGTCTITAQSGACQTLSSTAAWNGTISLNQGGVLTVWGKNAPAGAKSNFLSGAIQAGPSAVPAQFNIVGGRFLYVSGDLNNPPVASTMKVYVCQNGELDYLGQNIGAEIFDGYDGTIIPNTPPSPGTLSIDNAANVVTFVNGAPLHVSTQGTFELGVNTWLAKANADSAGTFGLDAGAVLVMANFQSLSITGGMLLTAGVGSFSITGDVNISNAVLRMGNTQGMYSTLVINGNLTMTGSTYSCDVNAADLSQCDQVEVIGPNNNITLDPSDRAVFYTNGVPLAGSHEYVPMWSRDSFMVGQFGTYVWAGGNPIPWDVLYGADGFELLGEF